MRPLENFQISWKFSKMNLVTANSLMHKAFIYRYHRMSEVEEMLHIYQQSANFLSFTKGQMVNAFSFVCHTVSVTTT